MQERRTEARLLCADLVLVVWQDHLGKFRRAFGLLEDISKSGACLKLESSVPPGTAIQLTTPSRDFSAHVRHCVYREIGYLVGVEFNPASKWSDQSYSPPHLLDLEKLQKSMAKRTEDHEASTYNGQ
jgi:hypothetical protein